MFDVAAQLIANGMIAGGIYSLVALGYTLVYGILKFINFAHGEVVMISAYFVFLLNSMLGISFWVAAGLSVVFAAILGMVIERLAYRPLRKSHKWVPLITALGVSLLLQSIALIIFGADVKTYGVGIQKGTNILGATVTQNQLLIIITSIVMLVLLYLFYYKTKWGKATRAVSEDREVGELLGINSNRVISITFAIGSAVGAIGGVLIGLEQNIEPTMGVLLGLKAFTAAVVGGIGSIPGAMVGGYIVGMVENIGIWFIPSGYKDAIAFVILILFLLFKPTGLFGETKEESVKG